MAAVFDAARPQTVFHLAAQIDVRHSVARPADDAQTNVLGTIAVLEAARATGVRRVVNTSTGGGLYGDADVLPTPEDSPIRPLAPYGQSKLGAEGYCALYTRLHGLSTVSLRYGNVYGPRQDVHGEAGVVAIFCGHLIDGTAPTVFGDGGQTRDWVDVADVVRANLLAADSEITGPVNIGHGQETSVRELIAGAQRRIARPAAGRSDLRARAARRGAPQLPGRHPGARGARVGGAGRPTRRAADDPGRPLRGRRRTARPGPAGRSQTAGLGRRRRRRR